MVTPVLVPQGAQVLPDVAEPLVLRGPWTVRTEVFDGPLDLLLYLVRRDGIDLRRIRVAAVCDAYLAFLDQVRALHLSLAADYLAMAATLVHLKSLELLPRPPAILAESEVDPREELARRLEAYASYKAAAEALDDRPRLDRDTFARAPADVGELDQPLVPGVDAFALLDRYYKLLTRPAPAPVTHTIHRPEVDLGACARFVLTGLGGVGGTAGLSGLLRRFRQRSERVVAFLAILEMTRLGWIVLVQDGHLTDVALTSRVAEDHPLDALRGEAFGFSADAEAG
ncbi:MAG: Segregation and condensation protein [Pseudomonadota bacterium]